MDASWLPFLTPLPAKKAAPPCETWMMTGDLESRAPSSAATTVDDEVQFCERVRSSQPLRAHDREGARRVNARRPVTRGIRGKERRRGSGVSETIHRCAQSPALTRCELQRRCSSRGWRTAGARGASQQLLTGERTRARCHPRRRRTTRLTWLSFACLKRATRFLPVMTPACEHEQHGQRAARATAWSARRIGSNPDDVDVGRAGLARWEGGGERLEERRTGTTSRTPMLI